MTIKFDTEIQTIIAETPRDVSGFYNHYQHTHDSVIWHDNTNTIEVEEVCINEYGSIYSRGVGAVIPLTVRQAARVPKEFKQGGAFIVDYGDGAQ